MNFGNDPLWYKDAVIYEVPVRAFVDSNGDGIGDFQGLTDRLDYLQDLGITAIWVLPFFPSPLRDDGYDVADYYAINSIYGTLEEFQEFVAEAHRREIYVIIELVINHTSDRHPWFQRARRAPRGSVERDFYVWSDTPDRFADARIIFQDFESSNWTWDSVAESYYWHRFYSHQPDLNFDHPMVREVVLETLDYWLAMGVDGLRLDAVPYLYEREGTNCENLPETHNFLRELRRRADAKFPNRMLLAEANQWPEDAVQYFGAGDECHMNFHFPLMTRLFMALHMEDNFPIVDILQQTPQIPETCQWAIFLRNHDELTLEMVSDEDRDYMYRVYARDPQARLNLGIRRRLAPLLGNSRRKLELMHSLLLSLPGAPVLYYGDEIGMGDNIYLGDRNGVRTPMQWSGDRNAGFSRANPQKLYAPVIVDPEYHYESVNTESQRQNPSSLWWWVKRILAVRKRHRAFSRGSIIFLHTDNRKILAFVRSYQTEHILVVVNLSRFPQSVQVDLSAFQHLSPVEMFGRSPFPEIKEGQYFLSLGGHNFYWFTLEPSRVQGMALAPRTLPQLRWRGLWTELLSQPPRRRELERILPEYWRSHPWYGHTQRHIQQVEIQETVLIPLEARPVVMLLVQVEYGEGDPELFMLPVTVAVGSNGFQEAAIAEIAPGDGSVSLLYEALWDEAFWAVPFGQGAYQGQHGVLASVLGEPPEPLHSFRSKPPHTQIVGGDRQQFKWYRQISEGIHPELELGQHLTQWAAPGQCLRVLGHWEYRRKGASPMVMGILTEYIPEMQSAQNFAFDCLRDYFERVMAQRPDVPPHSPQFMDETQPPPDIAAELLGSFLNAAEQLGDRTAALHRTLAAHREHPDFTPEPFTTLYQRSLYQYLRNLVGQSFLRLQQSFQHLPPSVHPAAQVILQSQELIFSLLGRILTIRIEAMRIRCHGDLGLGRLLYTGKDFIFVDFEGDLARPPSERRLKRSPLRDVAGMLHAIDVATRIAVVQEQDCGAVCAPELAGIDRYARFFSHWARVAFWQAYQSCAEPSLLPPSTEVTNNLLTVFAIERAFTALNAALGAATPESEVRIALERLGSLLPNP